MVTYFYVKQYDGNGNFYTQSSYALDNNDIRYNTIYIEIESIIIKLYLKKNHG